MVLPGTTEVILIAFVDSRTAFSRFTNCICAEGGKDSIGIPISIRMVMRGSFGSEGSTWAG